MQTCDNFSLPLPSAEYTRGCIRQVLSGSTRTADALVAASIWESHICCGCSKMRETPMHMMDCPAWSPGGDLSRKVAQCPSEPRFQARF